MPAISSGTLYLVSQVLELGLPTVIALNMIDIAEQRGVKIEVAQLAERLGVPVIEVQANRRRGIDPLKASLIEVIGRPVAIAPAARCRAAVQQEVARLEGWIEQHPDAGPVSDSNGSNGSTPETQSDDNPYRPAANGRDGWPRYLVERLLLDTKWVFGNIRVRRQNQCSTSGLTSPIIRREETAGRGRLLGHGHRSHRSLRMDRPRFSIRASRRPRQRSATCHRSDRSRADQQILGHAGVSRRDAGRVFGDLHSRPSRSWIWTRCRQRLAARRRRGGACSAGPLNSLLEKAADRRRGERDRLSAADFVSLLSSSRCWKIAAIWPGPLI